MRRGASLGEAKSSFAPSLTFAGGEFFIDMVIERADLLGNGTPLQLQQIKF
jgi:hypothetical protein